MRFPFALLAAFVAVPAAAQLAIPGTPQVGLPRVELPDTNLPGAIDDLTGEVERVAARALEVRRERIERLLRRHGDLIEIDRLGEPARRGELLVTDPGEAQLESARRAGFTVSGSESLPELDMTVVRLTIPAGMKLAEAQSLLEQRLPGIQVEADHLHFQSGTVVGATAVQAASATAAIATPVGVIDGAPGKGTPVAAQRGFAKGAPLASDHGSAVASLLSGAGVRRVLMADVYGSDPAGGNALAIARALDWLAQNRTRVVTISLVGPRNAVLEKAVARAREKGLVVVAAVGNDGPAAPPAYPASYPGVVAVTGVDGRLRTLLEAGRALHLDYAAPGADIRAANKGGKRVKVRGTSYAAPLVAARIAAALDRGGHWRAMLDGEAQDLGPKGADDRFGRGLVCRGCAR
ncbi:MAG: S8 family serine peptidase [Croceibacterium sp.]